MIYNKQFIIFLDIDGVLNLNWSNKWDEKSIHNLNRISDITNCSYVITSTWRANPDINLEDVFIKQNITGKILGITNILAEDRGFEIQKYLDDNNYSGKYLIIDDIISDIITYFPDELIIKTSFESGISDDKLLEILEKYYKLLD